MGRIFEYPVQILEKHLDCFGHVNNAVYLMLYEEARWDFITKGGFGLKEVEEYQKGPVILELNLKFKRELCNRREILIQSEFKGMKNKLVMEWEQRMIEKESKKLNSSMNLFLGFMDLKKRKLIGPTSKWLQALGQIHTKGKE